MVLPRDVQRQPPTKMSRGRIENLKGGERPRCVAAGDQHACRPGAAWRCDGCALLFIACSATNAPEVGL